MRLTLYKVVILSDIKLKSQDLIVERAKQHGLTLSEEGKKLLLQRQSEFNNPIEKNE
jgi:hypothetical protein